MAQEVIAVTVKEAARLIGCPPSRIRTALYGRELRCAKMGNSYFIKVADLTAWFEGKLRKL
jgi:excisionase family DNA binding protein